jgi:Transcription antiterminator
MQAYCAFCKTSYEIKTAQEINRMFSDMGVVAYAPARILKERYRGEVKEVHKPLMEGYVFVYGQAKLEPSFTTVLPNVIKLLKYGFGEYELRGTDFEYANYIYQNNGVIGISDIICVGKEVKVVSGPLEEYKGTIVKLDKRKERVFLRISFAGVEREISLSVNILAAV